MKTFFLALSVVLTVSVSAQILPDTTLTRQADTVERAVHEKADLGTTAHAPQMTRNGSGTLGQIFNQSACGLNFTQASAKTGQRFTPAGVGQPVPLNITGIPASAVIQQAFLWAAGSGNGAAQTATIQNPAAVTQNFPMTIVGSGPDKCWGYAGSHNYRADVTGIISGNGTYNVSGILTNPPTSGNDMDGIVLMVIYTDPCANYQGHLLLNDGMVVIAGGVITQTISGINACDNSINAQAFMCIQDLQNNSGTATLNGTNAPYTWNWWNYFNTATTVTAGQTTASFTMNNAGDCFSMSLIGLYYQTNTCAVCTTATGTATDPADVNLCVAGSAANFSTTAGGSTVLGYQWEINTGSGFVPLTETPPYSGVNTAFLTVSPTTAAMNGYQYRCVIDFCGPDITTAPATLNVAAPPVAVCKDTTLVLPGISALLMADELDDGSTVSCGIPVFSSSQSLFNCSHIGANNVTLTVTDAFSNTATCTSVVTVTELNPPTITCPGSVNGFVDPGACTSSTVSTGTAFAFDACDLTPNISNDAPPAYPVGTTTVTWTATDDAGNSSSCTQTVNIVDPYIPSISCTGPVCFILLRQAPALFRLLPLRSQHQRSPITVPLR